ncbi:MAG: hypothetical protein ACO1RT_06240 [Planctomycetaceae bacterium]
MPIKLNVGLSRKVGQPNFGSVGACCNVDIELDQQTIRDDPQVLHRRVQEAFAICRQAVEHELSQRDSGVAAPAYQPAAPVVHHETRGQSPARAATAAQVKAIHAISGRLGVVLASELQSKFGVTHPSQLSIRQASELIDQLKQSLTPSPA